jgi:mono/diheme cytochrome c family protein
MATGRVGLTDRNSKIEQVTARKVAKFAAVAIAVAALMTTAIWSQTPAPAQPDAQGSQFYTTQVQPIFQKNCYACHTGGQAAGLRVDSREALLKGGESGAALVPGEPTKSLLIDAVQQTGDIRMPKGGHLKQAEIDVLIAWVKMGAPWAEGTSAAPADMAAKPTAPAVVAAAPVNEAAANDFFENKIRPILAEKCYACHTDAQSGGLRIDSRDGILKGGETGPAIVVGDPDKSLLIQAVMQVGVLKMPKGGHLKPQQIEDLVAWVKMGAPWPASKEVLPVAKSGPEFSITPEQRQFWSFRPLAKPAVPAVKDSKWAHTDIDRFVLAKLESKGLTPVQPADRRTLLRRATIDLTGLPPTPEEIEAFEKDKSSGAFAKVIDRLLESPRYGERWGRHWLDVARYGEDDVRGLDPKGRGYMPFNGAYVYRDWVIAAFNSDMPYDRFVKAQLAGDQLDPKSRDTMIAGTGFLGQGPWLWDQAEPVQGRADERNERIDAVTRGFLGLTVQCARCHNHKYDPISQKDYYALGGVFASTTYTEYPRVSEAQVKAYREKEKQIEDLETEKSEFEREASEQLSEILAHQTAKYMVAAWRVIGKPKKTAAEIADEAKVDPEMLGRWVKYLSKPQTHYPYLNDFQAMIANGGGTEAQAKFLAGSFEKLVLRTLAENKKIKEENDIIKAKNNVPKRTMKDAKPNEFETQDQFCPGCDLELKALPTDQGKLYLDLFRGSLDSGDEYKPEPGVFTFYGYSLERQLGTTWKEHVEALDAQIEAQKKALPKEFPFVHGVGDRTKALDLQVNLRGSPFSLGDTVPRRFIQVLSTDSMGDRFLEGSGRLELANKIVQSPLASRVFVNRVWKWHFGTGLVDTPDNFGKMGEKPSNPELLEYLAAKFKDDGMTLKKLQKEIMLSAVYQLSTEGNAEDMEQDANNRYYWRFNRLRLNAEALRDSILFVAGDLDLKKTSGPSVEFSEDNTSRTVFCKVSRFRLDNFLQVFDFPNPSVTAEQRFATNVPLQRLYFMNNTFVYAQASKLAERVYPKGTDEERIKELYWLLFGRKPTEQELQLGLEFLKANPEKPGREIAGEPTTALKQYARALLSSNEFEFLN